MFKKYINKNNFIKISLYILAIIVSYILVSFFSRIIYYYSNSQINDKIWEEKFALYEPKRHYRAAFLTSDITHYSISSFARKLYNQAKSEGWDAILLTDSENIEHELDDFKPDFVVSLIDEQNTKNHKLRYKTYAYLLWATEKYFQNKFGFKPTLDESKYPNLERFSGYICGFKAISFLKDYVESKGKKFYGFRGFAYHNPTKYSPNEFKKVIYYGATLDSFHNNKYKLLFEKMKKNNLIDIYGTSNLSAYLDSDHSKLEKMTNSQIIQILKDHGISLIFHSKLQNRDGIPSSRFLESVAASTIIISDKNPFVTEHYKDCVLFIDTELSSNEMFDQIISHLNWIKNNKYLALQYTKNAHDIMLKKHNLHLELLKIAKMHEKLLDDKKYYHNQELFPNKFKNLFYKIKYNNASFKTKSDK